MDLMIFLTHLSNLPIIPMHGQKSVILRYHSSLTFIGGIYFVSQGRNVYQHNVTNNQRTLLLNSSSLPEVFVMF